MAQPRVELGRILLEVAAAGLCKAKMARAWRWQPMQQQRGCNCGSPWWGGGGGHHAWQTPVRGHKYVGCGRFVHLAKPPAAGPLRLAAGSALEQSTCRALTPGCVYLTAAHGTSSAGAAEHSADDETLAARVAGAAKLDQSVLAFFTGSCTGPWPRLTLLGGQQVRSQKEPAALPLTWWRSLTSRAARRPAARAIHRLSAAHTRITAQSGVDSATPQTALQTWQKGAGVEMTAGACMVAAHACERVAARGMRWWPPCRQELTVQVTVGQPEYLPRLVQGVVTAGAPCGGAGGVRASTGSVRSKVSTTPGCRPLPQFPTPPTPLPHPRACIEVLDGGQEG